MKAEGERREGVRREFLGKPCDRGKVPAAIGVAKEKGEKKKGEALPLSRSLMEALRS